MTPMSLAFEWLDAQQQGASFFVFKDTWSCLASVVDIIFIIEIIVCFNTSYYDEEKNEFETSRLKIAKNYLKCWFWVDLVAWMPRIFKIMETF